MATKARLIYTADENSLQKQRREFSIADELQQKIDSIEEGAQVNTIETIKVNGVALIPDEYKAVDIEVPGVIDSLDSTSIDDALSARQGKILYEYIQNLGARGRYLSNWDCATGLPVTNPQENPYTYMAGDYFSVSNVAASPATNYRPDGAQYVAGQASQTVEIDTVEVSDFYIYDGVNWILLHNSARTIAVDSSLSTTSTNPVENRVITNAINSKADITYVDAHDTVVSSTAPSNPAQGILWYDTTNNVLKTYDGTSRNECGGTGSNTQTFFPSGDSDLNTWQAAWDWHRAGNKAFVFSGNNLYELMGLDSAVSLRTTLEQDANGLTELCHPKMWIYNDGTNVTGIGHNTGTYGYLPRAQYVDNRDTYIGASAPTDNLVEGRLWYDTTNDILMSYDGTNWNTCGGGTTYVAGPGIEIGQIESYSAMQGPCDDGFHVPSKDEWEDVTTMGRTMGIFGTNQRDVADYTMYLKVPAAGYLYYQSGTITGEGNFLIYWTNTPVQNNTKAYMYGGLVTGTGGASATAWEISMGLPVRPFKDIPVEPDNTWTTLLDGSSVATGAGIFWDENEGLISISSDGQTWITLADKNIGATNVGDLGNYFQRGNNNEFVSGSVTTSSTAIDTSSYGPSEFSSNTFITAAPWSNPFNDDLWGGITGVVQADNAIINTGVLSVNGQTGDVVVDEGNTKTFFLSSTSDLTTAQAAYDRYDNGKEPIIVYGGETYIFSGSSASSIIFCSKTTATNGNTEGLIEGREIEISKAGGVYSISTSNFTSNFLDTNIDYMFPYVPLYNGSPATKQYVDDKTSTIIHPSLSGNYPGIKVETSCLNGELMQGPCDTGFHVPSIDEYNKLVEAVNNIIQNQRLGVSPEILLKIPAAGMRNYTGDSVVALQGVEGRYWTYEKGLAMDGRRGDVGRGYSIRPFANEYVYPDLQQGWIDLDSRGDVSWNQSLGLISVGIANITISDKNLGATIVWNDGDTLSESNCGKYYQWGNNYGFAWTGSVNTTNVRPDLTDYNPLKQYTSDEFVLVGEGCIGGEAVWGKGVAECGHTIYNTGVTSVNGQTGDVVVTDTTYTAGTNVSIDANNVISAVDTTYTAGEGIAILNGPDYSAMQGPAPTGYHVPNKDENVALVNTLTTLGIDTSNGSCMKTYLKMPFAGFRSNSDANAKYQGTGGYYWSSTAANSFASNLLFKSASLNPKNASYRAYGHSVRCFKNSPIIPTSSWTTLYAGTGDAGIFHDTVNGLISLSSDGINRITIQDKNLGATTVYNDGDTLSQDNCGNYYQWGNNYGFPWTGSVITSNTKVDASSYGPGNYYSSSTFITTSESPRDWSSVKNDNLRGGTVIFDNAITNTGVLSVNGQTGDVTIPEGDTKTFYLSNTSDLTTAQAAYDWVADGKNAIIDYGGIVYISSGAGTGYINFTSTSKVDYLPANGGYITPQVATIQITESDGTVTGISAQNGSWYGYIPVSGLSGDGFTPTENWHPATKKYVDDSISAITIPTVNDATLTVTQNGVSVGTFTANASNNATIALTDTTYTAGDGISINPSSVISNTGVISVNGQVGDVLVDESTKTFYLSGTSDLTTAQDVLDWCLAGKNAIIILTTDNDGGVSRGTYLFRNNSGNSLTFYQSVISKNDGATHTAITNAFLQIDYSTDTVTQVRRIGPDTQYQVGVLATGYNYTTPYTPEYAGSPATKKYVDDSISAITIPTYTAGTNVSIDANNVISATDTTYTAGDGISINSSSVISNTGVTSINGQVGDVLVDEGNTKTFYLSSLSDLTTAQAALDWYLAGKNPIIIKDNYVYLVCGYSSVSPSYLDFEENGIQVGAQTNSASVISQDKIRFWLTNGTVNLVANHLGKSFSYLAPGVNYGVAYTPEYAGSPATKKYVDDSISAITIPTYTAGDNIIIDSNNSISAVVPKYEAGTGISFVNGQYNYSAMQGPCPDGYHIPTDEEYRELMHATRDMGAITLYNDVYISGSQCEAFQSYYKMPAAGEFISGGFYGIGTRVGYWTCIGIDGGYYHGAALLMDNDTNGYNYYSNSYERVRGLPIRAFKNTPVVPESATWVVIYQSPSQESISDGGIYCNSSLGLISASKDGTNWITIMDKNLGATTVWNTGNTLSTANCGNYYQWGNNYGHLDPSQATTSNTAVDTTGYGPGNYYSSSTWIRTSGDWSNPHNNNLWGGESGIAKAITNIGVLSVNGQTGHVAVQSGGGGVLIGGETLADKGANFANYLNSINFTPNAAESIGFVGVLDGKPYYLQNMYYITQDVQYRFIFESLATSSSNVSNQSSRTYHELRRFVLDYDSTNETWSYNSSDSSYITTTTDKVLRTDQDYSNPYMPLYDGSPATKKYVDSKIVASSTSPSNPAEGMLWYDTTNDTLYSYDGSNRQIVGSGGGSSVQSNWTQTDSTAIDYIKNKPSLATVATSGNYNDLSNKPTIPTVNNGTLTIQKNGTTLNTFTANSSSNKTVNITVPTKTSDISNDSGYITSSSIPSVGNGTITINQGGVQKGTFTTNQSGNTTINLDAGGGAERYVQGGTRCLVHSVVDNDGTAESFYIGGENRDWAMANISFFCSSSSTQFEGHIHLAPFSFSSVYKSYNSSGTNVSYDYDNDINFSSFQRVCTIRKAGDTSKYLFVNIRTSGNQIYIESGNRLGESATFYYTVGGVYGDLTY